MTTDEQLDILDLEIIGLPRLLARETRDKLAARGFDVSGYEPVAFPHPMKTRAARKLARLSRQDEWRGRYGPTPPRSATGKPLLVRDGCGSQPARTAN